MKTIPAAMIFCAVCAVFGCINSDDILNRSYEANAFSCLKMIGTAQMVAHTEDGQFMPSIVDIEKKGYGPDRTLKQMVAAGAQAQNRVPFSGYYFADIRKEPDGSSVNNRFRYGLAAYPAKPGKDTVVFLLLMDMNKAAFREEEGGRTSGEEIQYWTASAADLGALPDRWPTNEELSAKYKRKVLVDPRQGKKNAEDKMRAFETK